MKTKLLFLAVFLFAFGIFGYGQNKTKNALQKVQAPLGLSKHSAVRDLAKFNKSGTFTDTIRYPQVKEQILGTNNFFNFEIWQEDNEAMSQTFLAPSSGLQVKGIEFYGRKSTSQTTGSTATVRASIYNVDNANNPTGSALATGTVAVTTLKYYSVNFSSPVSVTGNYAVVIATENTGGVVILYISNAQPGQLYDENLSRFKSTYSGYGNVTNWTPIPSVNIDSGVTYDFEPVVAPIVSYSLDTTATLSSASVCLGHDIIFTNTTSNPLLSNRMYNYNMFLLYFGKATTDDTFAWHMDDDSDLVLFGNTTYKYLTAGTYKPTLYTFGGFWTGCIDYIEFQAVVKPLPTATISVNGSTLSVAETGVGMTYEWVNCLDNSTVPGATSQTFTPIDNASYFAIVSINGCSTTSECMSVGVLSVEHSKGLSFDLYPNPADDKIIVNGLKTKATVSIMDVSARVFLSTNTNSTNTEINIKNLKSGVYFVKITSDNINEVRKFIKK